jgi:hypothetical protein
MDGAIVGREESLNDVGMSLESDELLLIGKLLEGITVPSMDVAMDGTIVGREESLNDAKVLVDGFELLLIRKLLEGSKKLFVGI